MTNDIVYENFRTLLLGMRFLVRILQVNVAGIMTVAALLAHKDNPKENIDKLVIPGMSKQIMIWAHDLTCTLGKDN